MSLKEYASVIVIFFLKKTKIIELLLNLHLRLIIVRTIFIRKNINIIVTFWPLLTQTLSFFIFIFVLFLFSFQKTHFVHCSDMYILITNASFNQIKFLKSHFDKNYVNEFSMERVRRFIRSEDSKIRLTNEAGFLVNKSAISDFEYKSFWRISTENRTRVVLKIARNLLVIIIYVMLFSCPCISIFTPPKVQLMMMTWPSFFLLYVGFPFTRSSFIKCNCLKIGQAMKQITWTWKRWLTWASFTITNVML